MLVKMQMAMSLGFSTIGNGWIPETRLVTTKVIRTFSSTKAIRIVRMDSALQIDKSISNPTSDCITNYSLSLGMVIVSVGILCHANSKS
jgi:hypothetical protein